MTENENIEITFDDVMHCAKSWSGDEECCECRLYNLCHTYCDETSKMTIKALEELKQYRAIGTVEGYKRAIETSKENYLLYAEYKAKVQGFEAIGTIEEFKVLKEDKKFLEFLYNHILPNEMEQYLSMYRIKDKVAVNGYADQCGLMPAT